MITQESPVKSAFLFLCSTSVIISTLNMNTQEKLFINLGILSLGTLRAMKMYLKMYKRVFALF